MDFKKIKLLLATQCSDEMVNDVSDTQTQKTEMYRIIYQLGGAQSIEFENGACYSICSGDLLLIPQQKKISIKNSTSPQGCYLLQLNKELIFETAERVKAFSHIELFYPNEHILYLPEKVRNTVEKILHSINQELSDRQLGSEVVVQRQTELLIITLFRAKEFAKTLSISRSENNSSKAQILKIVDYVTDNYNDDLSLELLSKLFFINKSSISRYFKEMSGQNFIDFLNRRRVEAAKEMLINQPRTSVMEVATRVGYNSSTYFERIFRRLQNCTPKEYRKNYHKLHNDQ